MNDSNTTTTEVIYEPLGGAKALFECRDAEVLLAGPAGSGKSRACIEKCYAIAELHPGVRILFARQTRRALTESTLAAFERTVLPKGHALLTSGADRGHRQRYRLANGSEIVLAGLDDTSRIMSSQYDLIYLAEATECSEDSWEMLISRLRNNVLRDRRTGKPWAQIIGCCNPAHPSHWLKQRCDKGQTTLIESYHADNPTLSEDYLTRLSQLTGVRRQRLYLGQWTSAEGQVYDDWSPELHLINSFPIPEDWMRIRAIDFGYRDPFVCLWIAVDPDGCLYVYREIVTLQPFAIELPKNCVFRPFCRL